MASFERREPTESNIDMALRRLGVDLGSLPILRYAADYVSADSVCKRCAIGKKCRWLSPSGSPAAPNACPNAKLLFEMMLASLPCRDRAEMH